MLWCSKHVYEYAYNNILNNNSNNNVTKNIIIDNTLIINKYGSQEIGYWHDESRKKKYTSLTTIINENNKPIIMFSNKINKNKI